MEISRKTQMFVFRKKRGVSDDVQQKGGKMLKRVLPERAICVASVERAAYGVGQTTKLFRVPRILGLDADSGLIEYEFIDRFCPLSFVLDNNPQSFSLLVRAASALAAIHSGMELPPEMIIRPPGFVGGKGCVIHGDYSAMNLGQDGQGMCIILDWMPAAAYEHYFNYAQKEYDIALFLFSLFECAKSYRYAWKYFGGWALQFLEAYRASMGSSEIDEQLLLRLIRQWGWRTFRWLAKQRKVLGGCASPVLAWIVAAKVRKVLRYEFK